MNDLIQAQRQARFVVCRMLRNHSDAVDDVLQTAALKAIKFGYQFRGEAKFSTYFTRIAINTALMYLRSSAVKSDENSVSIEEGKFDVLSRRETPEEFYIRVEREDRIREEVQAAIKTLSPCRQKAAYCWLAGKKTSSNAEKSNRHNARVILREMVSLKACL